MLILLTVLLIVIAYNRFAMRRLNRELEKMPKFRRSQPLGRRWTCDDEEDEDE